MKILIGIFQCDISYRICCEEYFRAFEEYHSTMVKGTLSDSKVGVPSNRMVCANA